MPQAGTQQVKKQHPVPQNIMSVEFKLIGDMTVRQFFYIATGAIIALIFLKSNLPFVMRWFGIILFGLGGVALAFIPLQERGLDVWLKSFFKAIFKPTQKVWKKSPMLPPYFLSDYAQSLRADVVALTPAKSRANLYKYLEQVKATKELDPWEKTEESFLENLNFQINLPKSLHMSLEIGNGKEKGNLAGKGDLWSSRVSGTKPDRPLKYLRLEREISLPKKEGIAGGKPRITEVENVATKSPSFEKVKKQIKELRDTIILARKELEKKEGVKGEEAQVAREKKPKARIKDTVFTIPQTPHKEKPNAGLKIKDKVEPQKENGGREKRPLKIKIVEASQVRKRRNLGNRARNGNANMVSGTVFDRDNHTIDGALLLIKDGRGNPERALKTNRLGKFATTTPVENGRYSIETRYQGKRFSVVNFNAEGRLIEPITIKERV